MKKSQRLITTTILTGTVFATSACQNEQYTHMSFSNPQQCYNSFDSLNDDNLSFSDWMNVCDNNFESAEKDHEKIAPRYELSGADGDDLCEEMHGDDNCYKVTGNDGSSYFVPFMAGYMISSMLMNNNSRSYSTGQPLYRSSTGSYATANSSWVGSSINTKQTSSRPALKPSSSTVQTTQSVKSTGGFGASRTSFSSRGVAGG